MDECLNCHKIKSLQKSHIIPEFIFKYTYSSDHKFTVITESNKDDLEILQKGFREELFCHDCEELLSAKERITSFFFDDIIKQNFKHIEATNVLDKYLLVKKYDYNTIKKCLLSILWRASISSLEVFKDFNLGPYNPIIQNWIFSNKIIPWDSFPIIIYRVRYNHIYTPDFISAQKKCKYNNITVYSLIIAGFKILYFVTEDFIEKNNKIFFMNSDFCRIEDLSINDVNISNKLINRMSDTDVNNFYLKHPII